MTQLVGVKKHLRLNRKAYLGVGAGIAIGVAATLAFMHPRGGSAAISAVRQINYKSNPVTNINITVRPAA